MTRKKITLKLKKPAPVEGKKGERGPEGRGGARGSKGERGPQGPAGDRGAAGSKGECGAKKFTELTDAPAELTPLKYVRSNAAGTKLELVAPPKSETVFMGGGAGGPPGAQGPPGPPGEAPAPADSVITRDVDDRVQAVSVEGQPTVTINRDANGRVTSVTSTERTVTIDRDAEDRVEGTTVSEP